MKLHEIALYKFTTVTLTLTLRVFVLIDLTPSQITSRQ